MTVSISFHESTHQTQFRPGDRIAFGFNSNDSPERGPGLPKLRPGATSALSALNPIKSGW
ncbi:MAG: hypothetical protein COY58_00045 [Gammaproteobacteria bacterium CG_4_10_14_0_8_um_filter_38_16]|nr:MAG: hypothetical protein COY58_00045 [Gammaproteobacteria bacterium CG_4_10_14_0_8_um_filter_38_16]PJA03005.1 MAG: hypothetical protein COX72_07420 [Gammaproteobacteria bacterium CG_4_10_14_0_2_um_filter_38_22]PJB09776.1 MAG: hypothetical protein CO120_08295 [Gammaproteobacteria bacterium CG_4_9_14_3_um_filter_38_9]